MDKKEFIKLVQEKKMCVIRDEATGKYLLGTEIFIFGAIDTAVWMGPGDATRLLFEVKKSHPKAIIVPESDTFKFPKGPVE